MLAALRHCVVPSVALVGAGAIAITPVATPPPADVPTVSPAVDLAAKSIANVPVNLVQMLLSAPAVHVNSAHDLADALGVDSWLTDNPDNVFGWDPANLDHTTALIPTLIPVRSFAKPFADNLNVILVAELPMYAGCTLRCPDPGGLLDNWFKVPLSDLADEDGYTYPDGMTNPIGGAPLPWSGQTVHFVPGLAFQSFFDSLLEEPTGVETVSPRDILTEIPDLLRAAYIAWNPLVEGSFLIDEFPTFGFDESLPGAIKGFLRKVCPDCGIPAPWTPPEEEAPAEPASDARLAAAADLKAPADALVDASPADVLPGAKQRVRTPGTASSDDVTSGDDYDAEPSEPGGKSSRSTTPGGPVAGVVKSVSDRLSSVLSNATDRLKPRAGTGDKGDSDKASKSGDKTSQD